MELKTHRIPSIDILRGIVMIIMALDHTRDFFHFSAMTADPLDPGTTTIPLFFTRWITHFCAPTFVFLSGISAFLSAQKKDKKTGGVFLIKRGLWLVFVEISLVTLGLTFNPIFSFIILQVIWAIGMSMILLGLFVRFAEKFIFFTAIVLILGHNALDYATLPDTGTVSSLWKIFFTARANVIPIGYGHAIGDFYAILPWAGIMFLGYSLGKWFTPAFDARKRKQLLLITGLSMLLIFIGTRLLQGYGDPGAYKISPRGWLSFLNTSKYPPSLQYSFMTLGPACIFLALAEKLKSRWTNLASIYGSVPFFYYILHFYILHILLVIVFFASGHSVQDIVDPNVPFLFRPAHFGYGLPVVYLIWLSVVAVLYLPCKWFKKYKATHSQWWLSYL